MKSSFSFFAGLLLLAVAPQLSHAEEQARVFRAVGLGDDGYSDLFFDVKGAPVAFTANSGSFSTDYPAPPGRKLSFYRITPPPADAPPGTLPKKTVVAEVAYPEDAIKVILLLYPAPAQSALPITGMAIADLEKQHLPGQARILNVSSLPAAFSTGGEVAEASPHTTDRVVATGTGPLFLRTAAQVGNGWKVVDTMERNLPAELRLFVIMVDAPRSYEGGPPVRGTFVYDFKRPPMKFRD
ncbi:MAG: hypothetical protein JF599_05710 [Verrucomicrobia bacterium]|nr:hypothetical protein [Verrucomicrobiota bacterium]